MNRKYHNILLGLILGILVSVMLGIAYNEGRQSEKEYVDLIENQQVLLDSKIHLVEFKIDVVSEHKEVEEMQSDFDHILEVLETSHQYTGEGMIERDMAMREAAASINEVIIEGGQALISAIEDLLHEIEKHLGRHDDSHSQTDIEEDQQEEPEA